MRVYFDDLNVDQYGFGLFVLVYRDYEDGGARRELWFAFYRRAVVVEWGRDSIPPI